LNSPFVPFSLAAATADDVMLPPLVFIDKAILEFDEEITACGRIALKAAVEAMW
jgi:hypothetical protein